MTISRGRKRVVVFTSDKDTLRANVERAGTRELALDLKTASTPDVAERVNSAEWTRRALAAIERTRLHNLVMERVRHGQKQRIAV